MCGLVPEQLRGNWKECRARFLRLLLLLAIMPRLNLSLPFNKPGGRFGVNTTVIPGQMRDLIVSDFNISVYGSSCKHWNFVEQMVLSTWNSNMFEKLVCGLFFVFLAVRHHSGQIFG